MLKKVVGGLFTLAIMGCLVGVIARDVVIYVLFLMMTGSFVLFFLVMLAANLVWRVLPDTFKKTHQNKRWHFNAIIFLSVLLFYFSGELINWFCLPDASRFITVLSYITTLVFVFF